MHWALRVVVWVLLPLWLALGALAIGVVLLWTILWALFDDEKKSGAAVSLTLTGLLLGVGLSLPSPWAPWSESVMDCGVASAALIATVWASRLVWPGIPRSLAIVPLLTGCAYVIAKGSVVASATHLSSIETALFVCAAAFPVVYSAAIARLWRSASTEAASTACRDLLLEVVRTPFSQSVVEGLHTVAFDEAKVPYHGFQAESTAPSDLTGDAPPRVGVVFLHGYAAGSVYFAFNFDDVVQSCAGKGVPVQVFAVDWRGQAASPREPFTPRTTDETEVWFIDSLERWRVAQGLERVVLIGHSLGGYLSSAYTLRHPRRVAGLILVSPAGIPSSGRPELGNYKPPPATGESAAPRAPPRIPRWVIPLVQLGWNSGITPGVMLRGLGPLGPWFSRRAAVSRISRMTLEVPLSPAQLGLIGTYFYHSNASDGSGEFALRHLLAPGAYAHKPIGARLVAAARRPPTDPLRLSCRITFVYGSTHDWMSADAGDAIASQLSGAGLTACVRRVGPAGHHVYLEAPSGINKVLCAEVGAALRAIASDPFDPSSSSPLDRTPASANGDARAGDSDVASASAVSLSERLSS